MSCAGTLGEVYRVPEKFENGIFNSVLMRFRVDKEKILPEYLELILQTKKIKSILLKDCIGIGIKNMIPADEIKEIKIPLPDNLEVQKRKVREYQQLKAKIEDEKRRLIHI